MRLDERMVRYSVVTLFAAAGATIMVYLWYIDLIISQRVFGALLAAELVIFAMSIYTYWKQSLTGRAGSWLLIGCLGTAVFLLLAIQLGTS